MTTQYKQYIYKNGEWRLLGGSGSGTISSVTTGSTNGTISVNGTDISVYGLNAAAYKAVDSSIAANSTSTNLPTSAAVESRIASQVAAQWKANTSSSEGYVASGSGQANKVWKTDADGVPAWRNDADTHYTTHLYAGSGTAANAATTASQDTKITLTDNSTVRNSVTLAGSGTITITSNSSGTITINGSDAFTGTVSSIATTDGITGGTITGSGTLKANLRSYTKLTNDSVAATETSGRIYPVVLDKTGYLAVNIPWTNINSSYLTSSSTLNAAKLSGTIPAECYTDTNTWKANSSSSEGYVAATGGTTNAGKVWKVDSDGSPKWLADTDTNTHYTTHIYAGSGTAANATTSTSQDTKITIADDSTVRGSIILAGSGGTTVASNNSGTITIASSGTVSSIVAGTGLSGGTITNSGTISANLKSTTSLGTLDTTDKLYAVGVDANGKLSVKVPWTNVNSSYLTSSSTLDATKLSGTIPASCYTDTNTWKANTSSSEGYVASGSGQANQVWKTDENGVPAWRDDENTHYTSYLYTGVSGGTANAGTTTSQNTYLNLVENGSNRSSIKITGGDNVQISSTTAGELIISSSYVNTWQQNTSSEPGYVAATGGTSNAGKVWKVSSTGTPQWLDDTDTHHQAKLITTNSSTSTTQIASALTNGNVYLNIVENNTKRSSHKISGAGTTTVTTNASGDIIISSDDSKKGTVTNIATGSGLTGGPITTSGTISLDTTSVTNGSYGLSDNATPSPNTTFNVPYFTVDSYGRLTAASTKTVKLPSDTDAYRNVLQTDSSGSGADTYPILLSANTATSNSHASRTTNTIFDYRIAVNPSVGAIYAPTPTVGDNSTRLATTAFVNSALSTLGALLFMGTVGDNGTVSSLPTPSASNQGHMYKVCSDDDVIYNGYTAKTGDMFICAELNTNPKTYEWTLVPSGDEPEGTVINIAVEEPLTTDIINTDHPEGGGAITGSGKIGLKGSGATAGSYGTSSDSSLNAGAYFNIPYITIDSFGRVTSAQNTKITLPTDQYVSVATRGTTKAYLLGTTTAPTSTRTAVNAVAETGVYFDTTAGTLTATTFKGSLTGNASTATKLATARSLKVALGSTTAVTFDGSAAQDSIPVSGTLSAANGGTGNTSFTANRLIYTESASKLSSASHYASDTQIAINSTSAPDSTYSLYVNGNTYSTDVYVDDTALTTLYTSIFG